MCEYGTCVWEAWVCRRTLYAVRCPRMRTLLLARSHPAPRGNKKVELCASKSLFI